jgi:hypothetical protein
MEPTKHQIDELRQSFLKKLKDDAASVPAGNFIVECFLSFFL